MDNLCKVEPRAFTNETWYKYKDNKLIYSIHQEIANKMTIKGRCYYEYDKRGRLIQKKEILTDTKNEYEPSIFYTRYKYDRKNRLIYYNNGEIFRYKYNRKNKIRRKEWEIDYETFAKSFHKYKDGREVLIKSSEGWIEKKLYKDNLILSIRRNQENEIIYKERRKLDNDGNVIEIKDTHRTYQYKYDNLNNIINCKEFDDKYLYRQTWNTYKKYKLIYTKETEYIKVPIKCGWLYD